MQYQDFTLEASEYQRQRTPDKRWLGSFKVRVLGSPAGEMAPEQAVAVEYDDRALQASLTQLDQRQLDQAGLIALGRTLALLLLPPGKEGVQPSVREMFGQSLNQVGLDGGLRLRLRLPPALAVLPWEYLYTDRAGGGDGMDGFLALDPRVAIVRHEALNAPAAPPLLAGDIKVVVALASNINLPPLDLGKEKADIVAALGNQAGIQAHYLEDATLDEVQSAVPQAGIFHFAGHGAFTRQMSDQPGTYSGTGSLAFDDQMVEAEALGITLRGNGIRLAVLSGCETGRREGVSVWSGIAPALAKAEIPAVVANQYTILDQSAIAFGRHFYQALVGGQSVEGAVSAGRIAAYQTDRAGRDWGVPVLYLRAADGQLFAGATDPTVREQARAAAEANIAVQVKEVAAGGKVLGAQVDKMLSGKLAVKVTVDGTVYGEVTGLVIHDLGGGPANVDMNIGTVGEGGEVTGANIDSLG